MTIEERKQFLKDLEAYRHSEQYKKFREQCSLESYISYLTKEDCEIK